LELTFTTDTPTPSVNNAPSSWTPPTTRTPNEAEIADDTQTPSMESDDEDYQPIPDIDEDGTVTEDDAEADYPMPRLRLSWWR